MKCNASKGLDIVCYNYEKCKDACICQNVPRGIREKLRDKNEKRKDEKVRE